MRKFVVGALGLLSRSGYSFSWRQFFLTGGDLNGIGLANSAGFGGLNPSAARFVSAH